MSSLTIVHFNEDYNFNTLFRCVRESDSDVFEIRYAASAYPENEAAALCNMIQARDKHVLLEVRGSNIFNKATPDAAFIIPELCNDIKALVKDCIDLGIKVLVRCVTEADVKIAASILDIYPETLVAVRTDHLNVSSVLPLLASYKNNVIWLDTPLCLASKYNIIPSTKAILDVKEFIDNKGRYSASKNNFVKDYIKKASSCKSCPLLHECFGCMKSNNDMLKELSSTNVAIDTHYIGLIDFLTNKLLAKKVIFDPRDPDPITTSDVETLQSCRLNKNFNGPNFYHVFDFQHSMYFNRHEEPLQYIFNIDNRGIPSLDFQFIGIDRPELKFKLKQDLLLPKHGVMVLAKVNFNNSNYWTSNRQDNLDNYTFTVLKKLLYGLGVPKEDITQTGNDLLYKGKKFAGQEWLYIKNVGYMENTVITCDYTAEKEWFDQLFHYDGEKTITGITEEVPTATKDLIIDTLYKSFFSYV